MTTPGDRKRLRREMEIAKQLLAEPSGQPGDRLLTLWVHLPKPDQVLELLDDVDRQTAFYGEAVERLHRLRQDLREAGQLEAAGEVDQVLEYVIRQNPTS